MLKLTPMKMGFASFSFPRETPIATIIESVKRTGFQGLEVSAWRGYQADVARLTVEDWRAIKRLCDETRLELPAIGCHEGYTASEAASRAEAMRRTRGCIDAASTIDVQIVVILSGGLAQGQSFEQAWSLLTPGVHQVVDYASSQGVTIAFEPHIGNLVDSLETMERLFRDVPSRFLKMNFDSSHFAVRGWDVQALVRKAAGQIIYVHLKDTRGIMPDYEFLTPGEGSFDITGFLSTLGQAGYGGYVTTEISGMRSRKPGYDPGQALRLSYETVTSAFREAGLTLPDVGE